MVERTERLILGVKGGGASPSLMPDAGPSLDTGRKEECRRRIAHWFMAH